DVLIIVILSIPKPKAKPEYFSESIPPAFKTFGCTIPQPTTSIHLFEPGRLISISALGSVKGKNDGLNLNSRLSPYNFFANVIIIAFSSDIETFSSIYKPSI